MESELRAEHAEIRGDDFKAGALLIFLVGPLARLNAAFQIDLRALFQILLGDFGLLAPDHNLVPLGALLALAGVVLEVSSVASEKLQTAWPPPV